MPSRYPSENYFHLVGDEWQPQALDDPDLPRRLLEAARRIHFPQTSKDPAHLCDSVDAKVG